MSPLTERLLMGRKESNQPKRLLNHNEAAIELLIGRSLTYKQR